MNLSKKIDISSKSSLVSLRAELARKQEEVAKARLNSQGQVIRPIPKVKKETVLTKKNSGIEERIEKDVVEQIEEQDALKKSRAALESKAKLYDKLSQSSTRVDDDEDDVNSKYLVNFQQKSYDSKSLVTTPVTSTILSESVVKSDDECSHHDSDDYDAPSDPEEDWVDYTDCLGRTRRCLRRDLNFVKDKDVKLSESLGYIEDRQGSAPSEPVTEEPTTPADPELLSADMRKELIRQKWETQEQALTEKSDVHYQDVLFDEARSHGVGYYGFSADEQKRKAQQDALSKLRDETQKQQATAQTLKDRRQQQLQARLKAAKQRKRARMGLPPDEDSEPEEDPSKVAEEEKKAAEERNAEEARKAEEEKDKLDRAKKRQYVRPWDVGKDGVTATEKEVLSQDEWVKKRRTVRDEEFAPPSSYQDDLQLSQSRKHRYGKSEKSRKTQIPTPIHDEVSHSGDSDLDDEQSSPQTSQSVSTNREPQADSSRGRGAEIAPPPTFEYCGPSSVATERSKKAGKNPDDVGKAIAAGLKYLRQQFEEKQKKQKDKGLLDII